MKSLFIYLKNSKISFQLIGSEVVIDRQLMTHELREVAIDSGLNIFELDTTIVIF